jgi:hypothetical protein
MTPNFKLDYLEANQAQKHVTVNEALSTLDAMVQLTPVSASLATQPASPAEGAVYILPPGKTGAIWGAMTDHALAHFCDGVWREIMPRAGWRAYVLDQRIVFYFRDGLWQADPITAGRERLDAPRTFYVRLDGQDQNNGLADTPGSAFRTIARAIDVASAFDLNGHAITIQLAAGTWTETIAFRSLVGEGEIIILGNEANPSSVYFNVTGAPAFRAQGVRGRFHVRGIKIDAGAGVSALFAQGSGAYLGFRSVNFGMAGASHLFAESGAMIEATGPYTISGNAERHAYALARSEINLRGNAVTILNAPVFSIAFVTAARVSNINVNAMTFTGTANGTRYNSVACSVIFTNAAGTLYLPGTLAGTLANSGQYL